MGMELVPKIKLYKLKNNNNKFKNKGLREVFRGKWQSSYDHHYEKQHLLNRGQ